jgi:DNA helicase HerA-like ATPase
MPEPALENGRSGLKEDMDATARERPPAGLPADVIGMTMFDQPGAGDGTVTVLLSQTNVQLAPAQSLVRIRSRGDGRSYLGVVAAGPFALPDSLRPDSPVLVAVATRGGEYLPPYHGRLQVSLLGEELPGGALAPPRLRPLPHSPVFSLKHEESAKVLKCGGDLRLGAAVGHDGLTVGIPSKPKTVLPRHTAILGTTGAGKSTTVAGLIDRARAAGMAVVVLDVEGEYTCLNEPTDQPAMLARLADLGLAPAGIPAADMAVYHLTGREPANPSHPGLCAFSLQFARLSPYAVTELLGLNDAQTDRFLYAYEISKGLLRELGIFPRKNVSQEETAKDERLIRNLDEFERGYPRLTLSFFLDVVSACKAKVAKGCFTPFDARLKSEAGQAALTKRIQDKDMPGIASSWGKLHTLLWRAVKLRVFHGPGIKADPINYTKMLRPGRLSVVDLSDAGFSELSNLAVADVLRGVQEEQERAYRRFEKGEATALPRVLIVIEEAHEFLSKERIEKMQVLFQQVSRLARRGRKRWLGLVFVTQLPQHLPRSVLGLCNSVILHRLNDSSVIADLRKSIGGIDDGLWDRLPALAPGQAVVAMPHLTKPLLVSIDPAPGKLRMTEESLP